MANRRLRTAQRNATAAKQPITSLDQERRIAAQQNLEQQALSQRGVTGTSGLKPTAGMQDVSSQIVPGTNFTYADIGIHSIPIAPDTSQAGRLAQLEGAKNLSGIQTPSQVTLQTRPEAGAPLQSPLSGVKGAGTGLGINPTGNVADVNGQLNVSQPEEEPAFPKVAYISPSQRLGNLQIQAQQEAIEASRAAVKTESLNQQRIKQQSEKEIAAAEATAEGVTPEQVGGNAALANLAKSSPEAQALLPYLEQFQNDISAQIQKNTEFVEGRLGETIDTFDSVDEKIEDMKSEYKTSTEMLNDFLKEAKDDTDKALALQQESLNNQLMWQQATERGKVMRQKAAQHDALVVQLALEGGFGQPAALRGVMETDAKFDQNLQELATFYGYKRVDLAAKFSGLYAENHQNYIKNTSDNLKEMRGAIERITTLGIQNKKDRQTEIDSIMEKGFERQDKYITEKSKATLDAAKEISTILKDERKEKREKEKNDLSMLIQIKNLMGSNTPQYLIEHLSKDIEGFDAGDFASRMTWEEIDDATDKSSAGSLGSAVRENLPTAKGLDFAIDRVATRMGGTAGERAEYRERMTNEIENGATEQDIRNQLRSDFWFTAKGVYRTDHDGREFVATNVEGIKGVLAQYGITEKSDGSLGFVSARFQGALSKFGLSTQEYNDLASLTGNLRATIIKEKYGAAVTPQELALAVSFVPEMKDKGVTFITKINNLQKMNEYLDEKYFAKQVGLPLPQNPFESVMQEDVIDDFSNEDIEGFLNGGSTPKPRGGEEGDLLSLGRITQDFNTPIAAREDGGLYSRSTVKAWGGKHAGIDIAAEQGTEIKAPFSGVVKEADFADGWGGTVVIVDDEGGEHRISHLSSLALEAGQRIERGQLIALSGGEPGTKGAGNSTGAHIDWRVRKNGVYVNPLTYQT